MTYVFISVLNECIPSRFAFQQPSLMKQKIELGHFPEFGKHLQKSVSDRTVFSSLGGFMLQKVQTRRHWDEGFLHITYPLRFVVVDYRCSYANQRGQ